MSGTISKSSSCGLAETAAKPTGSAGPLPDPLGTSFFNRKRRNVSKSLYTDEIRAGNSTNSETYLVFLGSGIWNLEDELTEQS